MFTVRYTAAARRALAEDLPETVASAVFEFITGPLAERPTVVGKPLRAPFDETWTARRGAYRVLYLVMADRNEIVVVRIDHRNVVCRQP